MIQVKVIVIFSNLDVLKVIVKSIVYCWIELMEETTSAAYTKGSRDRGLERENSVGGDDKILVENPEQLKTELASVLEPIGLDVHPFLVNPINLALKMCLFLMVYYSTRCLFNITLFLVQLIIQETIRGLMSPS